MSLNVYRDEVGKFLKAIDPENLESVSKILKILDVEFAELKRSLNNQDSLSHHVYDVLFLLFELAAKKKMDLDTEWNLGRQTKNKYME